MTPGGAGASAVPPDPAALLGALSARLDAESASGGRLRERVPEPEWPGDLEFHLGARTESVELLAVLEDGEGRAWSFVRRFDRVTVRDPADPAPVTGDDFAFRDVLRLGGSIDAAGPEGATDVTFRRDALERVTLGLAEVDPRRLQVRDAVLALESAVHPDARSDPDAATDPGLDADADAGAGAGAGAGSGAGSGAGAGCALDYALSEGDGLALRFRQARCPSGSAVGSFALATSPTLAASGTLVDGAGAHEVVGRGWVRRAWGELPTPGGAVVFDRLLLALDGVGLVEAERSKRRSGRGPRTTSGRLGAGVDDGGGAGSSAGAGRAARVEALDVTWQDVFEAAGALGAGDVPDGWNVSVPSAGIDVVLMPLADTAAAPGALGRVWLGAVRASGSHTGVGFVEFVPGRAGNEASNGVTR